MRVGFCSGLGFRGTGPFIGETRGSWIYSGPVGSRSGAGGPRWRFSNSYHKGKAACYLQKKTRAGKQNSHYQSLQETETKGWTEREMLQKKKPNELNEQKVTEQNGGTNNRAESF